MINVSPASMATRSWTEQQLQNLYNKITDDGKYLPGPASNSNTPANHPASPSSHGGSNVPAHKGGNVAPVKPQPVENVYPGGTSIAISKHNDDSPTRYVDKITGTTFVVDDNYQANNFPYNEIGENNLETSEIELLTTDASIDPSMGMDPSNLQDHNATVNFFLTSGYICFWNLSNGYVMVNDVKSSLFYNLGKGEKADSDVIGKKAGIRIIRFSPTDSSATYSNSYADFSGSGSTIAGAWKVGFIKNNGYVSTYPSTQGGNARPGVVFSKNFCSFTAVRSVVEIYPTTSLEIIGDQKTSSDIPGDKSIAFVSVLEPDEHATYENEWFKFSGNGASWTCQPKSGVFMQPLYDGEHGSEDEDCTQSLNPTQYKNRTYVFSGAAGICLVNLPTDGSSITHAIFLEIRAAYRYALPQDNSYLEPFQQGSYPVGGILYWPEDQLPPQGWLDCNGAKFSASQYPDLAKIYPSGQLPNVPADSKTKLGSIVRAQ